MKKVPVNRVALEAALKIIHDFPDRNMVEGMLAGSAGLKFVDLDVEMVHKLIDGLSTEFMKRGLQPDHEPNSFGYEIEDLIDSLTVDELYNATP